MAKSYDGIDVRLKEFIERQPVFFVATAPSGPDGHVNCSPKGNRDDLAVLGEREVAYQDLTGSGVETIAHLRENGRIVIMARSPARRASSASTAGERSSLRAIPGSRSCRLASLRTSGPGPWCGWTSSGSPIRAATAFRS